MASATTTKRRLGEILVDLGLVTDDQIGAALAKGKETGRMLGDVLLDEGLITGQDLLRALAAQFGVEFVDLDDIPIDAELVRRVPQNVARGHRAVPFATQDGVILVAMANPIDVVAVDDIRHLLQAPVKAVMADGAQIDATIERGNSADSKVAEALLQVTGEREEDEGDAPLEVATTSSSPLIRFVDVLLARAVQDRASDIHIEPSAGGLRVRFRIDGTLTDALTPPASLQAGLLSRVKVMADLDIAVRRRPQDGRTSVMVGNEKIDLRVATIPTVHGEAAVLRVLRPDQGVSSLEGVGLLPDQLVRFNEALDRPWGLMLVTGPTGSGKTTTLYAALQKLNTPDRAIVTVEDPVEYRTNGLKQVQVNPKAGLTFATAMRSFLRLDPDVMLVGEMRDGETARTAVESSLTGHLVLSSLHTNDAASAPIRMIDMGIEPYLISASTVLVTAQRLVRRLCEHCRTPEPVPVERLAGIDVPEALIRNGQLMAGRPVGCPRCKGTGYRGRLAIHEVLRFNDEISEATLERAPTSVITQLAIADGMTPLRTAGLYRVATGETSLEEVLAATA
ncbi:MAG: ATPase, T2SS/T4P/T4SS family [Actinomycetota bacterium]